MRALAAVLVLAAGPAVAQPESAWESQETEHFRIRHQGAASLGDHNRIERIYEALHPDLWALVPRLTRERIDVYVYRDQDAYRAGKFRPAPWSGGLFSFADGKPALAVYEPVDTEVTAHELSHLYLHTYFREGGAPPPWLDEGLAGMLQAQALAPADLHDKGPVLRSPAPLAALVGSRPGRDSPGERVGAWYQQAHSLVRFLKREHVGGKFRVLCERLRAGADSEEALREAYGYEDLAALEKAWSRWRPKKAAGLPQGLDDL